MAAQVKRTDREDKIGKTTRTIRDRAYRACGYDRYDPEYQIVVWTLAEVRREFRKQAKTDFASYFEDLQSRAKKFSKASA